MRIRIKAKNPRGTHAYHVKPYTVQHFCDGLISVPIRLGRFIWFASRYYASKKFRLNLAREYNATMFGAIPTSQIYVYDRDNIRPMREDERTWPE